MESHQDFKVTERDALKDIGRSDSAESFSFGPIMCVGATRHRILVPTHIFSNRKRL